jgi:hypothetical protein
MQMNPLPSADSDGSHPNLDAIFDDGLAFGNGAESDFVPGRQVLLCSQEQLRAFPAVLKEIPRSGVTQESGDVVLSMNLEQYLFAAHKIP